MCMGRDYEARNDKNGNATKYRRDVGRAEEGGAGDSGSGIVHRLRLHCDCECDPRSDDDLSLSMAMSRGAWAVGKEEEEEEKAGASWPRIAPPSDTGRSIDDVMVRGPVGYRGYGVGGIESGAGSGKEEGGVCDI